MLDDLWTVTKVLGTLYAILFAAVVFVTARSR